MVEQVLPENCRQKVLGEVLKRTIRGGENVSWGLSFIIMTKKLAKQSTEVMRRVREMEIANNFIFRVYLSPTARRNPSTTPQPFTSEKLVQAACRISYRTANGPDVVSNESLSRPILLGCRPFSREFMLWRSNVPHQMENRQPRLTAHGIRKTTLKTFQFSSDNHTRHLQEGDRKTDA